MDLYWTSGRVSNLFQNSHRVPRPVSDHREGPPNYPKHLDRSPDPFWISRRVPQQVPDLWEGPWTCPEPLGGSSNPFQISPRVPDQSRTFDRVPRPVSDVPEVLPTRPGRPRGSSDPSRTSLRFF